MTQRIRIGLIGAGANTRKRHVPGFRAVPGVEIAAVCNRRPESTAAAAKEFGIPKTYSQWEDLVADPDVDAIMIGTWPYLHAAITLAAFAAGKHVLTEARMAMNAAEAHAMRDGWKKHPKLVAQIVPSPYGLRGNTVVRELLASGAIGAFREATVTGMMDHFGGPDVPMHWRQDASLCGLNMLSLGIFHETMLRWVPPPMRVVAMAHAFIPQRLDPESGIRRAVTTPDSVQAVAVLEGGGRAVYQFNGITSVGVNQSITLYGSSGMLRYDFAADRIGLLTAEDIKAGITEPREVPIPDDKAVPWTVEADFIDSIRHGTPVKFTDFDTGVAYMEFTEAVARSARDGLAVNLPLSVV
jgi:predicted dehydrogenase